MHKYYKIFLTIAILLVSIFILKITLETKSENRIRDLSIQYEAKTLADLLLAFRTTYQNIFINNNIKLNETNINFLPVKTTNNIAELFSQNSSYTKFSTVSDKPRNTINMADTRQSEAINSFNNDKDLEFIFKKIDEKYYYSQPLYITSVCLKCHGKKENAPLIIQNNYDMAYNYKLGDLRGIIDIELKQSNISKILAAKSQSRAIFVSIVLSFLIIILFIYTRYIVKLDLQKDSILKEQSRMAGMGEMIGNIAHQWRQPLSIISTASSGIKFQKEFSTLTDENLYKMCDTINNNAQYLSKTIDDFKNFIKGDRTKHIFNLYNIIDSFLHLIDGTVKSHNIKIILELNKAIEIDGYSNELMQCFINIFNNAKDILAENKITDKLIFITAIEQDDKVIIKIRDNAGGIPEDVLPKIFEPYFTTKDKSKGTGLGLHMTHDLIVDGMNGSIEAYNVEYKHGDIAYIGAEFIIILPLL